VRTRVTAHRGCPMRLHRDHESFIPCQAGLFERPQLVRADVPRAPPRFGTVEGLPAAYVRPATARFAPRAGRSAKVSCRARLHPDTPQGYRPRPSNCCRWAASCARPSLVIPVVLAPAAVSRTRTTSPVTMTLALKPVAARDRACRRSTVGARLTTRPLA